MDGGAQGALHAIYPELHLFGDSPAFPIQHKGDLLLGFHTHQLKELLKGGNRLKGNLVPVLQDIAKGLGGSIHGDQGLDLQG